MAVATAAAAGGNKEAIPPPTGIAATAANGSQQGHPAEGVFVVGSMAARAEGIPVIDLTAVADEEEEEKKDHSTAYTRRESSIDLNLTAPAEEEGEDEKEGQGGVDGPRAEGVPVIDLTEESNDEEEEEEVRWVGQYSSTQSILLVGDGDFSFSLALATGFGSGANLVATSLDSYDTLKKKYSGAESNLAELKKMGAVTLHGVNAKTMKLHTDLKTRRFDRVIFNFPHAGFKGKENHPHMIKKLVKDFFRSASLLLRPDGEVHVSHKTKNPYRQWNLEELASEFSLFLVEQVDFRIQDYPGYNNKRGDGLQCDLPFLLGKCSTFKFKIGDIKNTKRVRKLGPTANSGNSRNAHFNDRPIGFGPFNSALLVPEMPQAYVPFHMPSVPVFSEFFVHEAVPWYPPAEAGMCAEGHRSLASAFLDLGQLLVRPYNCRRAMLWPAKRHKLTAVKTVPFYLHVFPEPQN